MLILLLYLCYSFYYYYWEKIPLFSSLSFLVDKQKKCIQLLFHEQLNESIKKFFRKLHLGTTVGVTQ